jgi:DNA modification methylase
MVERKISRNKTYAERLQKEAGQHWTKLAKKEDELVITDGTCSKCNAWKGSLGLEPDFRDFVRHLCEVFDLVQQLLTPYGSCWVNLGDGYYTKSGGGLLPPKCLVQVPSRFSIKMTDDHGWTLRNEVIWLKPNPMPSSTRDRFTIDFEKVYFFTKQRKYYFEQQFDPLQSKPHHPGNKSKVNYPVGMQQQSSVRNPNKVWGSALGRNKRTTWVVPTKAFPDAHFAVYPTKLVTIPIKATCPERVCLECSTPRVKIYKGEKVEDVGRSEDAKYVQQETELMNGIAKASASRQLGGNYQRELDKRKIKITYQGCECNGDYRVGIAFDPFMGAGTTALVARKLGRDFIGIELSKEYKKIADARLRKNGALVKRLEAYM